MNKICEIIETDPESISENKDIFTQVLAAIDDETLQTIFQVPDVSQTGADHQCSNLDKFKRKTQTLIYNLIVGFYVNHAFAAYPKKPSIE